MEKEDKKPLLKGLKGKKKTMMEHLITTLDNVSESAKRTGISRRAHYNWLEDDPVYKGYYDDISNYQVDFYQSALNLLVKEKNAAAIIFGLKCKGKHRGWTERNELELSGNVKNELSIDSLREVWKEVKNE